MSASNSHVTKTSIELMRALRGNCCLQRLGCVDRKRALMKFRPLHDRVVIRRLEGEERTKGGILIPDTVKEKPQEGEVIAVGPGGRDEAGKLTPMDLKAGDRVLFGKW